MNTDLPLQEIYYYCFFYNYRLFVTGAYDNMVRLWNSSGECVSTLIGHTDSVKSVAFGKVNGKKNTEYERNGK
jgi:WD40 repeat protein